MLPTLAIIGRQNVGKSTLFNCLTRSRDALVADFPGLTRDRVAGLGKVGGRQFLVIDTGGLGAPGDDLQDAVAAQAWRAAAEATRILFVVDARAGLTGIDQGIAARLRTLGIAVLVVANKAENLDEDAAVSEFHALGFGPPIAISAAHQRGVDDLVAQALADVPADTDAARPGDGIRVAVLGRPNVGKSTLVNRMLGEERVLVADSPGTTRDSIAVPFERDGVRYILIDTAGMRRRARIAEPIEKLAVLKSLAALAYAQVAVFVIDARAGIAEQDAALLGLVLERGAGLVIALNKWDGMTVDERARVRSEFDRRLPFVAWASCKPISALHGSGVGDLFELIRAAHAAAFVRASPAELTAALERAAIRHQPPLVHGRRVKLRYAHLGGHNPPRIIIHGSQVGALPSAYGRYLENAFRDEFDLRGTPVRIEFRQGENPYAGKRNRLTQRQVNKRRRLVRHVRGK